MIKKLIPAPEDIDTLVRLWESSVQATHDFLHSEDISFFRRLVREEALGAVDLFVIRNDGQLPIAFAGIAGNKLEMLFVAPHLFGKGYGRRLVEYAITHCGVRSVDVNEQNTQAVGFYNKMGFRTVSRDAVDSSGKPYPILHLEITRMESQ